MNTVIILPNKFFTPQRSASVSPGGVYQLLTIRNSHLKDEENVCGSALYPYQVQYFVPPVPVRYVPGIHTPMYYTCTWYTRRPRTLFHTLPIHHTALVLILGLGVGVADETDDEAHTLSNLPSIEWAQPHNICFKEGQHMAKRALLDWLESTIGRYVENLDANSLNVAVWSGRIELKSLRIDCDAINEELTRKAHLAPHEAAPVRIVSGSIDCFTVEIPWVGIVNQPVVVRARGLRVLVEPYDHLAASTDMTREEKMDMRKDALANADDQRKCFNALWNMSIWDMECKDEGDGGFLAVLGRRIIENIKMEIYDVHVSLRWCGSSLGVVLESLSKATTNDEDKKAYIDRSASQKNLNSSFFYKAVTIKGLGVYCDEDFDCPAREKPKKRSYILFPRSFEATIRETDLLHCVDDPKFFVLSHISDLSIAFTPAQLQIIDRIGAALAPNKYVARPLFPEYRPMSGPIKGNAKEWWQYAVRCIGRLSRRTLWKEFYMAYRKCKRYLALYMRSCHCDESPWLVPLTTSERLELESFEQDQSISVYGIMRWRTLADAQLEKDRISHQWDMSSDARRDVQSKRRSTIFRSHELIHLSDTDEDSPPITLTVHQMKELTSFVYQQESLHSVSRGSKIYKAQVHVESFEAFVDSAFFQSHVSLQIGGGDSHPKAILAEESFCIRSAMMGLFVGVLLTAAVLLLAPNWCQWLAGDRLTCRLL